MNFRIGYEIEFSLPAPTAMMLMLYTHPSRNDDLAHPDVIRTEPETPVHEFTDGFGNRCGRIVAPAGRLRLSSDNVVRDSGASTAVRPEARQHEVGDLPDDVLQFLLPSRYCEVDRLSEIAWGLFGGTTPGWARVQAVCDWVHESVTFGYEYANPTKSAFDVYQQRAGVCRDFTHLSVTFCRCLNIPARYATGYLGDIGVPLLPGPMDFSAWFEVYLDGRWHTFDARFNMPRIGRILMARGRDAVDVALTTTFGSNTLEQFTVRADEISGE